ncbi:MAG: single-stranded-DNA-specific exonuclease RecJ, partial [Atribacterota bacterium]
HLDLVAVGTIADSVPLLGENRILVKYGLDKLSSSHKRGLQMLLEYHNNNDFSNSVLARDISFGLIPVLNSTGRIDNPQQAVDLLLTDSSYRAQHLINKMLKLNERRKALTLKVLEEAREIANKKILLEEQKILVLSSRKWHPGLVGIVASRLMEEFSQPVMMISINKGIGKGSGRNQGEFDFSKILSECSELLNQYGGHQYAAGITISEEKIDLFGEQINRILKTNPLINQFGQSVIKIDSLIDFNEINWNLLNFLDKMKPFGPGNTEPVFGGYKFPLFSWKRVGKDEKHLKLVLGKSGNCIDGIAFQMAEKILDIKKDRTIDVAFQLSKNYWKGKNSLQLMVKDIK